MDGVGYRVVVSYPVTFMAAMVESLAAAELGE
jgi:hypothetical protein